MDTQQAIVQVSDRPKVGDLINEFKRNGSQGDSRGVVSGLLQMYDSPNLP